MAERRVLRMGHPALARVASPVTAFGTLVLHGLVTDLWDTMEARGGIGLAATQIGEDARVVVFGMEDHPLHSDVPPVPRTVLVNPVIEPLDEATEDGWEGCLSLPGLRGVVPRWLHIRYHGRDADGHPVEGEAEGFHARVVQHECDHLDGILYPQRMRDMRTLGFEQELRDSGLLQAVIEE